jgi:iron complex transport system substrate-binding protein
MRRVVSLIASATEIVCALGGEAWLVGRSHECDYPPAVKRLPVCTRPRFDVEGSSRDIDQRVKETLQASASVYDVDADLLRRLRPDVLVTQAQCDVCAVSERDVRQALASGFERQPQIVTLNPNSLADVWADIRRVAAALDVSNRGEELIGRYEQRLDAIAKRARSLAAPPSVACLEWIDPLMAAGNWMPELVELAGGSNLFGEAGKHSPWLTWEQLCERDPEVLVVLPCGFDIERTRRDMPILTSRAAWPRLSAVQNGRVFLTDGNQYFNRPGPRLVESLEILAELLHPEHFHFGHEDVGWQRL